MLMSELGAQATPAIFYLDDNGRLQQHQGAPRPMRWIPSWGRADAALGMRGKTLRAFSTLRQGNRDWVDGQSHPQ